MEEDREAFESCAADHLLTDSRSQEKRVLHQHVARECIDRILSANQQLVTLNAEASVTQDMTVRVGQESLAEFYARLRNVRDYHQRHPHVQISRTAVDLPLPSNVIFSGAEHHGRHLDLNEFYDSFLNLRRVKLLREQDAAWSLSYREYCSSFYTFSDNVMGKDSDYANYLSDLIGYLIDFVRRSQPLLNVDSLVRQIELQIDSQFQSGEHKSWSKDSFESVSNSLYCEACDTLFVKETTFSGHLSGKKHARNARKLEKQVSSADSSSKKAIFCLESKMHEMVNSMLSEVVSATVADVEKKQARTLREQMDAVDQESDSEDPLEDEV